MGNQLEEEEGEEEENRKLEAYLLNCTSVLRSNASDRLEAPLVRTRKNLRSFGF